MRVRETIFRFRGASGFDHRRYVNFLGRPVT